MVKLLRRSEIGLMTGILEVLVGIIIMIFRDSVKDRIGSNAGAVSSIYLNLT